MSKPKSNQGAGDDSESRVYSIEQARRILGISYMHAYNMAKSGDIPTVRLGRRWLVPKAAIDKLLNVNA